MQKISDEIVAYLYDAAWILVASRGCPEPDQEEVVQDAVVHVARYWKYDPERRKASWRTYASRALGNRIYTTMKRLGRHQHEPLSEKMPATPSDTIDEMMDWIDEIVEDPQWRQALKLKAQGLEWREVATEMNRRWTDFRQPLETMLQMLRPALKNGEWLPIKSTPPFPNPPRKPGRPPKHQD